MDNIEREKHFELFWKYLKEHKDFEKLSLKQLLWKVYNQACADCGQDASPITIEEAQKMVEDMMFFNFVQDCILNPSETKPVQKNDYVKVVYDCEQDKCVAYPDRCNDVGCNGNGHTVIVNLSKLCGIDSDKEETVTDKILSSDEIKELSEALKNMEE